MYQSKVFYSLPCLSTSSSPLLGDDLIKTWFKGGDRRQLPRILFNLINLNTEMFEFIGITPSIRDSKKGIKLSFKSTNFIGAVPLISPINGKPLGDFIVYPRYIGKGKQFDDYLQIIHLLNESIQPEFNYSRDLISNDQARPPLFYECIKFVELLFSSINTRWQKFSSSKRISVFPKGTIVWRDYIKKEFDPKARLRFPCKVNELSKNHIENQHLSYVYEIARQEIHSHVVPPSFHISIQRIVPITDEYFSSISPISTTKLRYRNSDPKIIRDIKEQGNKILNYSVSGNKAWRIDFAIVFEKYIQYLFKNVCDALGYKLRNNPHLKKSSFNNPGWTLKYLEPDMNIFKGDISIFLDAKYKSHFYNLSSESKYLTVEHRNDLHQIAAYCAFENTSKKLGFLCYPSNNYKVNKLIYSNTFNSSELTIMLFGIPISYPRLKTIEKELKNDFSNLVNIFQH